ncbi:hypothetical protein [Myxococcus sp. NMCA1]|uniref:hypothetical protein n=1 Tax=Myxococcus sp. NMCA1 TaxID=2996785 RepID=UPI002285C606|nr:hypothetical protein [Myxococcus sp. NMCA1]WAM28267.1 hypothetical protein OZ403_09155 [Myxococcus sp. NMCA1]
MSLLSSTQHSVIYLRLQEQIGDQPLNTIGAWLGLAVRDKQTVMPTIGEQLRELIRFCEDDGLHGPQPLLLQLLIRPELLIHKEIALIVDELQWKKATLAQNDPFGECLLMRKPFINRSSFREVLKDFVARNPMRERLLVVNGPPRTGKSYSQLYISHLKAACEGFAPVWFSAVRGQAESYTPDEVARSIVGKVGGDIRQMPVQRGTENRWAQELSTWVINQLSQRYTSFCLLLDGFRAAPPATHALIFFLAEALTSNLHHADGRLVIIDYDPETLAELVHGFEEERLDSIQKEDVKEFFVRVHPAPTPENVDAAVAKVFAKLTVTPADEEWQSAVSKAVMEVTREL